MSITQDLTTFFAGLNGALNSYRRVRSLYDEQAALGFNYTSIFGPDENKTSDILKFLLDPNAPHGQKATFLKLFLECFDLRDPLTLLEAENKIVVNREYLTYENRRIDITVHFGENEYVIGIENKIWEWTPDQQNQLKDYAEELKGITNSGGKWVLFYLTPNARDPSESSIDQEFRTKLIESKNLRIVSYTKHIIELFERFELACKADNVRAFLKDFKQYLKQQYQGETIMGDQRLIVDYVRNNSTIIGNIRPLNAALDTLQEEYRNTLLDELKTQLGGRGMHLVETKSEGGKYSLEWSVRKSDAEIKFRETPIHIRIQANWSQHGLWLGNGVDSKSRDMPDFRQAVQAAGQELDPHDDWNGGSYSVSDGNCLTEEKLARLLEHPEELQKIVSGWVSRISNYVDTVIRVCNQGTAGTGSTPQS